MSINFIQTKLEASVTTPYINAKFFLHTTDKHKGDFFVSNVITIVGVSLCLWARSKFRHVAKSIANAIKVLIEASFLR